MTRRQRIDSWWENGFPGAFAVDDGHVERRVRAAFERVLTAISSRDFGRFMQGHGGHGPTLVCLPYVHGLVFTYFVPALPPTTGGNLTMIYLAPIVSRLSNRSLDDLVAHECAHVVLGHTTNFHHHGGAKDEAEADRKVRAWGFRASYVAVHLRQLRRDRQRFKKALALAHRRREPFRSNGSTSGPNHSIQSALALAGGGAQTPAPQRVIPALCDQRR
jgi:hypothetical protein